MLGGAAYAAVGSPQLIHWRKYPRAPQAWITDREGGYQTTMGTSAPAARQFLQPRLAAAPRAEGGREKETRGQNKAALGGANTNNYGGYTRNGV